MRKIALTCTLRHAGLAGMGRAALVLLCGVVCFWFWYVAHPEMLNYHEQNQLFLTTTDYFLQRMSVAGGLVDWLSESIVQLYYVPWLGALCLALLLSSVLLWVPGKRYWWGLVLPVLLTWHLSDANVLLSFVVALWLSLAACRLASRMPVYGDVLLIPVLYWLIGPVAWVYAVVRWMRCGWRHAWMPLELLAVQVLAYHFWLSQYPLSMVMCGINYYRVPLQFPALQFVIPAVAVLVMLGDKWVVGKWARVQTVAQVAVLLVLAVFAYRSYDKDYCETLRQDMLVRQAKWDELIQRAQRYQVKSSFSSNCVNLALGMRRQLADRMFEFYQSGGDALLQPCVRDNTSNLPTAEAFYYLGMVNSCLRYYSDLQESILNARKSGRCEQRIAECLIVNGNYRSARKHIDLLKQSLFYRRWAKEAEACLDNDARVNAHPQWGWMRRQRYKSEFLHDYQQMDKMLGLLFVDCPDNKLALDYFMAQMLLNGNTQGFAQHLSWVAQYGGYADMPYGYRDALNCIQSHNQQAGTAYGRYVGRMMRTHQTQSAAEEGLGK